MGPKVGIHEVNPPTVREVQGFSAVLFADVGRISVRKGPGS